MKLDELYYEKKELYERAIRAVEECLEDIVKDFAGDKLFRVDRISKRLKKLNSVKWKAYAESIPFTEEVFIRITDIAGVRVVVNNLQDIQKVIEKIKESGKIHYDESSYEDKISIPDESGYRGVHFNVFVDVEHKGAVHRIPCEVQIRTLFQDGWAILSHRDIYKNMEDIPPIIYKLSRRLADQLAVMDDIAQDIREELSKKVEPVAIEDDKVPITKQAMALIYYELFSEKVMEFELQIALKELTELGIPTVEELRKRLPSDKVYRKLDGLHRKYFGGWKVHNMDSLVWGIKVMLSGDRAYREFIDKTKEEWDEVVAIARREILSELPKTVEELIRDIKGRSLGRGFYEALEELGGVNECDLCGTNIFEPVAASEVLSEHYETEDDAKIVELTESLYELYGDGTGGEIECEDAGHSGLCPHCAHLIYDKYT